MTTPKKKPKKKPLKPLGKPKSFTMTLLLSRETVNGLHRVANAYGMEVKSLVSQVLVWQSVGWMADPEIVWMMDGIKVPVMDQVMTLTLPIIVAHHITSIHERLYPQYSWKEAKNLRFIDILLEAVWKCWLLRYKVLTKSDGAPTFATPLAFTAMESLRFNA